MELVTARLRLRPPTAGDAAAALPMLLDPASARWNPVADLRTVEDAVRWCERQGDWSDGQHATFSVLDRTRGTYLGVISLHEIDTTQQSASVGFRTHPDARGRQVAPEAVDTVTRWAYAYHHVVRVQMAHAVENVPSCRVAQRAGYLLEGTLRQSYRYGDRRLHDEHLHARLADDPVPAPFPAEPVG